MLTYRYQSANSLEYAALQRGFFVFFGYEFLTTSSWVKSEKNQLKPPTFGAISSKLVEYKHTTRIQALHNSK